MRVLIAVIFAGAIMLVALAFGIAIVKSFIDSMEDDIKKHVQNKF